MMHIKKLLINNAAIIDVNNFSMPNGASFDPFFVV